MIIVKVEMTRFSKLTVQADVGTGNTNLLLGRWAGEGQRIIEWDCGKAGQKAGCELL